MSDFLIPSVFPLSAELDLLAKRPSNFCINPRIPQSEVNPLKANECARIGRLDAVSGVKTGSIKVDDNLKKSVWKKTSNYAIIKVAATTS